MHYKKPAGFESAESKARQLISSPEKTRNIASRAERKAKRSSTKLGKMWERLTGFIRMTKAWSNGEYRDVSIKTMVVVVAAILYFLNPFDVIPDFLPFLGYLDDATVIGFVSSSITNDIEKFLEWERLQKR